MAYIKYNANPSNKRTTDCAIRAVATACGISWDDAYKELANAGFAIKEAMHDLKTIEFVLCNHNFKIGKVLVPKGSKRPKVAQFSAEHPNWTALFSISGHVVASVKGNYYDTWDCGSKSLYKYYYKEI